MRRARHSAYRWRPWLACAGLLLVAWSSSARDFADGGPGAAASGGNRAVDPFRVLREAYAARDAELAASAYAPGAVVEYRYDGAAAEVHRGRDAIAASFRAFFAGIDAGERLDLDFRATRRDARGVAGVYRLRVGRELASIGRFEAELAPDGRFARDLSTSAPDGAFEDAAGPTMFAATDEVLDREYYDRLAGRYRRDDGCDLVITRSVVRLFALDTCSGRWRGLTRVAGREWTAGARVLGGDALETWRFDGAGAMRATALTVATRDGVRHARRRDLYRTESVHFVADDGVQLAGRLLVPTAPGARRSATVLVHGSGPQDRDGYASILAVLADALASAGRVVLVYDKRGAGLSGGDGERAGFARLADDAAAALRFLRRRSEVHPARVGLAGSSQAGWVVATAIERGAAPADVLLLGAAGSGVDVATQNLWNTAVRMQCAGIAADDVALALEQQRAFFGFLAARTNAATLDAITARARTRPPLADWLFPDSRGVDSSGGAWYTVLDLGFDPLPVWRSYRGPAWMLLAEHDDSTPSAAVRQRLAGTRARVEWLDGAQHLGLRAAGPCAADLRDTDGFAPRLFDLVGEFARRP